MTPDNKPSLRTRHLLSHEWELFRRLRLASLEDAPTAFGTSLAEAAALTDKDWQARTVARCDPARFITILGLDDNAQPVAMASGVLDERNPAHAMLISMWVDPAHRRSGLGQLIVEDILAWARQMQCTDISLSVTETNHAALGLYQRVGFRLTGTSEPSRSYPHLRHLDMCQRLV